MNEDYDIECTYEVSKCVEIEYVSIKIHQECVNNDTIDVPEDVTPEDITDDNSDHTIEQQEITEEIKHEEDKEEDKEEEKNDIESKRSRMPLIYPLKRRLPKLKPN
jgi:hypothetical protein